MNTAQAPAEFCLFSTPLGACGIAWRGDTVIATRLPDGQPTSTKRNLAKSTGGDEGNPSDTILRAIKAIKSLLEGKGTDLGFVHCDMNGISPFSKRVYDTTREIPAGETLTYGAIAEQLGDKQLSQQVGQALGNNPFPIIVPCHRVLGANGKLTGFSATGGTETKLKMLEIEGAVIGETGGLFDNLPMALKPR
ncbi:MAG: methylated-DNA--[protein]-cysteine S-methyltransferase [Pseudomonadota bacterium]